MKSFLAAVVPAVCLMLAGAPALAQEAIQTQAAQGGAPPVTPAAAPAATPNDAEPDDVWARRVLNAATASGAGAAPADGKAAAAPQCAPNGSKASGGDGKPHGEVWAGAGTRGYRDVGGVVTQPVGACGSVTLMVDHTEGGFGRFGGRTK